MSYTENSLNEECGICGVINLPNAFELVCTGLYHLQHRGHDGAGIVAFNGSQLQKQRGLGLVSKVFDKKKSCQLMGSTVIGHVRYATAGTNTLKNIQPIISQSEIPDTSFAYAHNGHLLNAQSLKNELQKKGAIFQTDSDSEVLEHLIQKRSEETFVERLKGALNEIRGAFVYLVIKGDQLFVARDPHGFRPVSIGKLASGYIIASETCVIDALGATLVHDVAPGELVTLDNKGFYVDAFTNKTDLSICSMEFIYFSRPDSVISGMTVYVARENMGKYLAQENHVNADLVLGVPDSGIPAAIGFSKQSEIPFEAAIIKNKYIARTFIQPTQILRDSDVHNKFSVVKEIVKNKKIVIVDDSMVRGTTMKKIVQLLQDAGAKEVHIRIASPPFVFPCFFGIDIPNKENLIACKMNIQGMKEFFNATSLAYLSERGLVRSVHLSNQKSKYGGMCISYFNGDYPMELYDYSTIN